MTQYPQRPEVRPTGWTTRKAAGIAMAICVAAVVGIWGVIRLAEGQPGQAQFNACVDDLRSLPADQPAATWGHCAGLPAAQVQDAMRVAGRTP